MTQRKKERKEKRNEEERVEWGEVKRGQREENKLEQMNKSNTSIPAFFLFHFFSPLIFVVIVAK